MEKEKLKVKQEKKNNLWFVLLPLVFVAIVGYKGYETIDSNNKKKVWASPTPTVEAITKQEFEDLPVGLIYEVSAEDQEKYLETAKTKYELYKDLGPQQISSHMAYNEENYLKQREDVIVRGNSNPMNMLNNDMSLRYPDMFYGFIIHDDNITLEDDKEWASFYNNDSEVDFRNEYEMADKMNQIFYIENQYINGGIKYLVPYANLGTEYNAQINNKNYNGDYPQSKMIKRGINSGFFGDNSNNDVSTVFNYMFASAGTQWDQYMVAYFGMENNYSSYYYKKVNKIDLFPDKYNDVENWEDTYAVYYYPKAVWKVDNNTIVVDIAVVNGDKMGLDDMYEILAKLNQANRSIYASDEYTEIKDDTYMVLGRFFDAKDITNGIMPEYGTYCLNYYQLGDWRNGRWDGNERGTFVFNDKAKKFLSEFYDIIEAKMEKGTPSTQSAIKQAAKKVGISYQDGLNIYATHYSLSTMNYGSVIQWQ